MAEANKPRISPTTGIQPVTGPDGQELYFLTYDIVNGPLEEAQGVIAPELTEELDGLHNIVMTAPAFATKQLEAAVEQMPDLPMLKNWLYIAYMSSGRDADADAILDRTVRDHPDYLFGRIALAQRHILHGQYDRVLETLGGVLDLKLMYPHRTRFHISEVVALWGVVGQWLACTGETDAAMSYYEQLCQVAPDDPVTERLEFLLLPQIVKATLREMVKPQRRRSAKQARKKSPTKENGQSGQDASSPVAATKKGRSRNRKAS